MRQSTLSATFAPTALAFTPTTSDVRVIRAALAWIFAVLSYPVRRLVAVEMAYRCDRATFRANRAAMMASTPTQLMPTLYPLAIPVPVAIAVPEAAFAPVQLATADPFIPFVADTSAPSFMTEAPAPAPCSVAEPLADVPAEDVVMTQAANPPVEAPSPKTPRKRRSRFVVVAGSDAEVLYDGSSEAKARAKYGIYAAVVPALAVTMLRDGHVIASQEAAVKPAATRKRRRKATAAK